MLKFVAASADVPVFLFDVERGAKGNGEARFPLRHPVDANVAREYKPLRAFS